MTPLEEKPRGARNAVKRVAARIMGTKAARVIGPRTIPQLHRFLSRATGGRFELSGVLVPSLLLRVRGAKSGIVREIDLVCAPPDAGETGARAWVIVGSNFGREHHPVWTVNLLANPRAEIVWARRTVVVDAELLGGDERREALDRASALWPGFPIYTRVSGRELRVFRLTEAAGTPRQT